MVAGGDLVAKGDLYFQPDGTVIDRFSPIRRFYRIWLFLGFKLYHMLKRMRVLLLEDLSDIFYIALSLPIVLVCLTVIMLGSFIALFDRDYLFNKITARENAHVV